MMKRPGSFVTRTILLVAGIASACAAQADFNVTGPDGRRIMLKDDGTWRYVEQAGGDNDKAKEEGEATLQLERKTPRGNGCLYSLRLVNKLPYEIRSLVLYYSAYRANGVIYDTVAAQSSFGFLKPGDQQQREVQFNGIGCDDIDRVQVGGGDRCVMGDLDKFSAAKGQCLARVRVVESDLVRFDK
jgi:hypothetical protein